MPLGREVGLSPSDIVLDGPSSPSPNWEQCPSPSFRPMSNVANGWMDQDGTWYGDRPRPSDIVLDGDPAPPL